MTHMPYSPDYYRTKFYQKNKEYRKFENITEEDLITIAKKVYLRQENTEKPKSSFNKLDKLNRYMSILNYLTSPNIHLEYKTYDERILFLILSVDPNLIEFKEYLNSNILSLIQIERATSQKEKEELTLARNVAINEFITRVRDQLGFYDTKLLVYEEAYFKKFLAQKELVTEVKQDHISRLLATVPFYHSLNVSEERYQELKEKAMTWISLTNKENDLYTAAYSCNYQADLIGLNSNSEKLLFFILVADPELNCLKIYEEESLIPEVKRRMEEQFNYFNMDLISLEKIYHEQFCPTKKISPWTHM